MEKSKDIYTLPAEFGWSNLGSWGSLRTLLPQDEDSNAKVGKDIRLYDCKNCVVHTADETKVVVQGLDGYIIAEKHGQLLVCQLKEDRESKNLANNVVEGFCLRHTKAESLPQLHYNIIAMAKFIELHLSPNMRPVCINVDAISYFVEIHGRTYVYLTTAEIKSSDSGGSLTRISGATQSIMVSETYSNVKRLIED